MPTWDGTSEKLVAAFQKNSREQVYVRLHTFEGRPLIDIPGLVPRSRDRGMRPTAKGVAVSTELYEALVAAVAEVGNYLE